MGIKDDNDKVNITSMYFIDVTLLWWHRRFVDENKVRSELGLGRSFKKSSRSSFTNNMSRKRFGLSCTGSCNKTQLGSM